MYLGPNKYFVASDVGNSRQQWYGFQLQKEGMADNVNNKETLLEMFKVRLRARWVTLRARWVTLIARWETFRRRGAAQGRHHQYGHGHDGAPRCRGSGTV